MSTIDISGMEKAAVLAALFNASRQQGLGFFNPTGRSQMTPEQASSIVAECGDDLYFDYLHGRVMKIDISGDSLNPRLYDRDNGEGACAEAISPLHAQATPAGA